MSTAPPRPHLHVAAGAGRAAAAAAARAGGIPVRLPAAGLIRLPAPNEIGWLAGMALLAGIGILDWPVAVVLAAGHLLSEQQRNDALHAFGEALEHA